MSKHNVLSEEDLAKGKPTNTLISRIEEFRVEHNLSKEEMKILDWGCGRGRTVIWLRDLGYDAYGIDIDIEPVSNGWGLLRSRGLAAEDILTVFDSNGRGPFPDKFFDFVCSNQVFEHIADINMVANEISRVTKKGGGGVHIYPAHRYFIEGHLFMPLVHWLPKNRLRHIMIYIYLLLGIDPKWPELRNASKLDKSERYYQYLNKKTYYRTCSEVSLIFKTAGLRTEFDTINGLRVKNHPLLSKLATNTLMRPLINWVLLNFISIHLVVSK